MLTLRSKRNFGWDSLSDSRDSDDTAHVQLRDGGTRPLIWRGWLDIEAVRASGGYRPVLIVAQEWSPDHPMEPWRPIPKSDFVQGAALIAGLNLYIVYGVVQNGLPRFVKKKYHPKQ